VEDVRAGDRIVVRVSDGRVGCRVEDTMKEE
jgi:hypothetical protein